MKELMGTLFLILVISGTWALVRDVTEARVVASIASEVDSLEVVIRRQNETIDNLNKLIKEAESE